MRRMLGLLLALITLLAAPAAHAQDTVGRAADALQKGPVYVHPEARDQMSRGEADALADRIEQADSPVFVAVLPAEQGTPGENVLRNLRTQVGIAGVYAVQLGDGFGAAADSRVLSNDAVGNLRVASVDAHPDDPTAQLTGFADDAAQQASGSAPAGWDAGSSSDGIGTTGAIVLGVIILAAAAGTYLVYLRSRRRREEQARAELAQLRVVVDEDITAFGEEMTRIGFSPADPDADDAMREDYGQALDSYETAKSRMDAARQAGDVRAVTEAIEEGRFALATLEARRTGEPLPERRAPCFFDPRHGPSVTDVQWSPPGAETRTVPACAADANLLAAGQEPMSRTVPTDGGPQPYWNAGPAYAPWAGGYFGAGLLPGLLVGTMLGQMMFTPGAWADTGGMGEEAGYEGGDHTGADFDPGDFGGGFGGGGGDFGGGF